MPILTKIKRLWRFPKLIGVKFIWLALLIKLRKSLSSTQLDFYTYFYFLLKTDFTYSESENLYFVTQSNGKHIAIRNYPSSDALVYNQIFIKEEYLNVIQLAKKHLAGQSRINIIDVGANVGYSVRYWQNCFPEFDLRIIAIEPDSNNLLMTKKNNELYGAHNVQLEASGLHNKSCFLKVTKGFMGGKEWGFQVEETLDQTDLKSIELSDIIKKYKLKTIDILKIDIEGSERFIFQDKDYAMKFLENVSILALEIHDLYPIRQLIYDRLTENGFSYFDNYETTFAYRKSLIKVI